MSKVRLGELLVASLLAVTLVAACDGGSGNSPPPPAPPPPPPPQQNPCIGASLEPEPASEETAALRAVKLSGLADDTGRYRVLDQLWKHRLASSPPGLTAPVQEATVQDVGNVSVVQDQGDVILRPNTFDLRGVGLRFTPDGAGYDVARIGAEFRPTLGNPLSLQDDDTTEAAVPFAFQFYGRSAARAFINSDGNVTFGAGDRASSARDVARLLTGPPRVAPFLADLDPTAGGRIFLRSAGEEFTVTWCEVRGFGLTDRATLQMTLLPGGTIEMKYAEEAMTLGEAVVGLSPGRTGDFNPVDLSAASADGGSGAVGERFARDLELDFVALTRRFYASHPDIYDQLVIYSDIKLTRGGTFAFEFTVANEIRGIGLDVFDTAGDFGSAGRLRSVVMMDLITKYPDDPLQKFLGEDSTVSVLGQEVGHRWLAFMRFRDHNGRISDALLGRDLAHWSFFFDSDASAMEGNDIEDLGGGSFRTVGAVSRYSRLDQYAMGLLRESDVRPFFYVEAPTNVQPARQAASAPQIGVTFRGTKRTVLLADVIAALGRRQPAAGTGSRVHRQAFLFIVAAGRTPNPAQIEKVDRIRRAWLDFFSQATDKRARAETRLNPPQ